MANLVQQREELWEEYRDLSEKIDQTYTQIGYFDCKLSEATTEEEKKTYKDLLEKLRRDYKFLRYRKDAVWDMIIDLTEKIEEEEEQEDQ